MNLEKPKNLEDAFYLLANLPDDFYNFTRLVDLPQRREFPEA